MAKSFTYKKVTLDRHKPADSLEFLHWWQVDKKKPDEVGTTVVNQLFSIIRRQQASFENMFSYARVYENQDGFIDSVATAFGRVFDISTANKSWASSGFTFNGISSTIDSLCAKVAKSKPNVKLTTAGGDFSAQKIAKQMNKIMLTTFKRSKMYKISPTIFRDACIFGTGCGRIYLENGQPYVDRVIFPLEIFIDRNESRYGLPKDIYYRKLYSKSVLIEMFPDYKEEINAAPTTSTYRGTIPDQIAVVEAFHLPLLKGKKNGRRAIVLDGGTVVYDEVYEKDYFPFVFINYKDHLQDFQGQSMIQDLIFQQLELTKLSKMITVGQEVNCVPRIFAQQGSIASKNSIYDIGIVEIKPGAPMPQVVTAPAASADVYRFRDTLKNEMYEQSGVSQLSAASAKPAGLESGVALQEYQDIETERFSLQAQKYQDMFVEAAKIFIDLFKDEYESNKNFTLKVFGGNTNNFLETIKWKDVNLDEDDYVIEAFPVSQLPSEPSAKYDLLTKFMQSQLLDKSQFLALMELPDFDNFYSLSNATYDKTMKDMENIIQNDESVLPDMHMDLSFARVIAQSMYVRCTAENSEIDQDKLDLLENYISECDNLLRKAQEQANPPQPAAQAAQPQQNAQQTQTVS